jgi:hypothetical protein
MCIIEIELESYFINEPLEVEYRIVKGHPGSYLNPPEPDEYEIISATINGINAIGLINEDRVIEEIFEYHG